MKKTKIKVSPGEINQTDINDQSLNTPEKMNEDLKEDPKTILDESKFGEHRIGRSAVHTR